MRVTPLDCPRNVVVGGLKPRDAPNATRRLMQTHNELDAAVVVAATRVFERRKQCVAQQLPQHEKLRRAFESELDTYQRKKDCRMEDLRARAMVDKVNVKGTATAVRLPEERANPDWLITSKHCAKYLQGGA